MIKIPIDLSINKSIKICKTDLIDIDFIDHLVEIDETQVYFVYQFILIVPISLTYIGRSTCSILSFLFKIADIGQVCRRPVFHTLSK